MKKLIYPLAIFISLANISCKKSTDGNKNVLIEDRSNVASTNMETTKRYVAEDGSSALVTIKENQDENSISIKSNNNIISAPLKSKTANGGIYEKSDFEIVAQNDTVTITQGQNVIVLKKARGE